MEGKGEVEDCKQHKDLDGQWGGGDRHKGKGETGSGEGHKRETAIEISTDAVGQASGDSLKGTISLL